MGYKLIKYSILFLLFIFTIIGIGQTSFDNPQIINAKSGLPTDRVNSILKDDQGFMWFATSKGLCRWDGISTKVFQHDPADSNSISGNFITRNAFFWDGNTKQIIMCTENGLSFLNPHKLTFKNLLSQNNPSADFLNSIHCVFVDRQEKLWLGTDYGIIRYNRKDSTFKTFNYSGNFPENYDISKNRTNIIFDIKQDVTKDSILWVATLGGLIKFNKNSGGLLFFYYENKNYNNEINTFNKIIVHPNRNIYLGTWNSGMVVFNTKNEQFELSCGAFSPKDKCVSSPVVSLIVKSKSEIWISSLDGLGIFNTSQNSIKLVKTLTNASGRRFSADMGIIDDKQMIWLATEYGAYLYNLSGNYFDNYFIDPVDENHWFLPSSLYEDTKREILYLGYLRGQGINLFDLKTKTFHEIPLSKRLVRESMVWEFLPLNENNLLVLSSDEIYKLTLDRKNIVPLNVNFSKLPGFTDMAKGDNGSVWVSGIAEGLVNLNLRTGQLTIISTVKMYFKNKNIQPNIKEIAVDYQNRVWFRNDRSYGFYDPDKNNIHYFEGEMKKILFCFYQDASDTIWGRYIQKWTWFY